MLNKHFVGESEKKPGQDFIRVSPKYEPQASASVCNMLDTIVDYHVAFIPLNGRLTAG